jgi:hypothetical protein
MVAGFLFLLAGTSFAFHDGGVAHCNGCHTMHNSEDGVPIDATPFNPGGGNPWLLVASTPSETCLSCHFGDGGGYHVFANDPLVPTLERGAGDFVFLTEDNINDGHSGASNPILGKKAGHNINAPAYGVLPDDSYTLGMSPGGSFAVGDLNCSSCHDPHGNQNFRLLYGAGEAPHVGGVNYTVTADAVGFAFFGPAAGDETSGGGTAYQSGMSAWCSTCHEDMHQNSGALLHPSGEVLNGISANYNAYVGEGVLSGTPDPTTSFIPQVSFEGPERATTASTQGPSATSQVSCITCHRAHATSSPNAGRWDFNVTFLDEDGLESGAYALTNPYGPNQRSLCNKCHVKDTGDAPL